MFTKQVSRPVDSLDPPSWPPRLSRSIQLEQRPGHGPDPRFLCPTGSSVSAFGGSLGAAKPSGEDAPQRMAVDVPPSRGPGSIHHVPDPETNTDGAKRPLSPHQGGATRRFGAGRPGHLEVEKREDGTWRLRSPEWSRSAPRTEGIRTSGPSRASEPGGWVEDRGKRSVPSPLLPGRS